MTKWKVVAVCLLCSFVLSGVLMWRLSQISANDRFEQVRSQAQAKVSAITETLTAEARSIYGRSINPDLLAGRTDRVEWSLFKPYYGIVFWPIEPNQTRSIRLFVKEKSPGISLSTFTLDRAIGALTPGKGIVTNQITREGDGDSPVLPVLIRAVIDSQKKKHLIYLIQSQGYWVGFIDSGDSIQAVLDRMKTPDYRLSVVNPEGITLAHSEPEYIGTKASEDVIMNEIHKVNTSEGRGFFDISSQNRVFANYERCPWAMAYVIATTPADNIFGNRWAIYLQVGFIVFSLFFLLVGYLLSIFSRIENTFVTLRDKARGVLSTTYKYSPNKLIAEANEIDVLLGTIQIQMKPVGISAPPPPTALLAHANSSASSSAASAFAGSGGGAGAASAPAANNGAFVPMKLAPVDLAAVETDSNKDKMTAYMKVATAIGHELRGPLTAILGYAQAILTKSKEPFIVAPAESIVRETRDLRSLLDKLFTFSGVRSQNKLDTQVESPIKQALKNLEVLLQKKGIVVNTDFSETIPFVMTQDEMVKAFECLISNSIEAMERMMKKEITIKTNYEAGKVFVTVSDVGEGIDPENLAKVFDPFFTTRSYAHHVGLGLSVAAGIFKENGGQVNIQSQRGRGTVIKIAFTPPAGELDMDKTVITTIKPIDDENTPTLEILKESQNTVRETKMPVRPIMDLNLDKLLDLSEGGSPSKNLIQKVESVSTKTKDSGPSKTSVPSGGGAKTVLIEQKPMIKDLPKKSSKLDGVPVAIKRPSKVGARK